MNMHEWPAEEYGNLNSPSKTGFFSATFPFSESTEFTTLLLYLIEKKMVYQPRAEQAGLRRQDPDGPQAGDGQRQREEGRRGGSPSSARAKIAKRLKKATSPIGDAISLVQLLWPLEAKQLTQLDQDPTRAADQVRSMALRHGCVQTAEGWVFKASGKAEAPKDPWTLSDPWAMAMTQGAAGAKPPERMETVLLDLDDGEKATRFEKKTILSKCHAGDVGLVQALRWKLSSDTPEVVLSEAKYVLAIKEALSKALPSMIFLERMSNHLVAGGEDKSDVQRWRRRRIRSARTMGSSSCVWTARGWHCASGDSHCVEFADRIAYNSENE